MAYDKVIDSQQLDNDLTSVATAIRSKAGTSGALQFPQGFVDAVNNMSSAEGVWEKMQKGTLTEYVDTTKALSGGFSGCSSLKTVSLPQLNTISIGMFESCSSLETVDAISATTVRNYAFSGCSKLKDVSLDSVTNVGINAFYNCSSLCEISLPKVKSLDSYAFSGCTSLTHVDIPLCTFINQYCFQNATSLEEISLPNVSSIGGINTFSSCTSLKKVDLPKCNRVSNNTFYQCSSLKAVMLRNNALATLSNKNAFSGSGVEAGTGYIYVPATLVDRYKTNWSAYASQIRALEDYTVDGTTTGELDESKI